MSKSRIISRVLHCVICELNPADVCLKGSVLSCCFLSSCISELGFPSSFLFSFPVWAEHTGAVASSLAALRCDGPWRGAGKEGSGDSCRRADPRQMGTFSEVSLKIGLKQTGRPKANPYITRGTWTSITPCNFLHICCRPRAVREIRLFSSIFHSYEKSAWLHRFGHIRAPLCFHFPYCKLSLTPSL